MAKIILMAMSLRKDSLNKKLINSTTQIIKNTGSKDETELLSFNDFPMPIYDGDLEAKGFPKPVQDLSDKIHSADAVVFSTPEYNGGMPGSFKNAFDWVSRIKPNAFTGKHILLISASPGALGGTRGLWHSRVPLEAEGCFVYPNMFILPKADQAFDEKGNLKDAATEEKLKKLLGSFLKYVEKAIK